LLSPGSSTFTTWKRRVLLEVLLVLGPCRRGDRAQFAARERRLQQVRGVVLPFGAAGADQRVRFVDEQDDRLLRTLHLLDHLLQAVLELALHASARLQQTEVERVQLDVAQRFGNVAGRDAVREALDDRGLPDAGLAREDRVVLPLPRQDVDDLADLGIAAEHGVELVLARRFGEVRRELVERGCARRGTAAVVTAASTAAAAGRRDRFGRFR